MRVCLAERCTTIIKMHAAQRYQTFNYHPPSNTHMQEGNLPSASAYLLLKAPLKHGINQTQDTAIKPKCGMKLHRTPHIHGSACKRWWPLGEARSRAHSASSTPVSRFGYHSLVMDDKPPRGDSGGKIRRTRYHFCNFL